MKDIQTFELTVDNIDFEGISAISIVNEPAIEVDFIAFSKQEEFITLAKVDNTKHIVTGPILIPDIKIPRRNKVTGEIFNVFLSVDTCKLVAEQFMINQYTKNITVQHQLPVNNISVIELWSIEDSANDKANALGFNNLPAGTIMASLKVNNETVWSEIMEKSLKGFSIEGFFSYNLQEFSLLTEDDDITEEQLLVAMQKLIIQKQ